MYITLTSLCLNRVFCMRRCPFDIGPRSPRRHTDLRLLGRRHLPGCASHDSQFAMMRCNWPINIDSLASADTRIRRLFDAGNEERHRREGLTCPDAFVVVCTKPESGDSAECPDRRTLHVIESGFNFL